MNREQVWELVRRLRLRLVVDNSKTSDNIRSGVLKKERDIESLGAKSRVRPDILCQLHDTIPNDSKNLPEAQRIDKQLLTGGLIAKSLSVPHNSDATTPGMIANAGELKSADAGDIPNDYQFEIMRLRRRVDELECIVRDRDRRVVAGIAMLEDELAMYRTLLHEHIAETHDGIMRRIIRIESALATLKAKGSTYYPPLPIPKRWQKP